MYENGINQYLKVTLDFEQECTKIFEPVFEDIFSFEMQNAPSGYVMGENYEIIAGDLSCDGAEFTVSLINADPSLNAREVFQASSVKVLVNESYAFVTKEPEVPLRLASHEVLVDLSKADFVEEEEVDPEEECPEKLSYDYDTLNLKLGEDHTIDMSGFQYVYTDPSSSVNGIIDCRTNFTYTV